MSQLSHQVAKGLEFQLQTQSSNEYSGLISFRMDWLDLLAVQGTFRSLLQHHPSEASVLRCLAFFVVQLSYLHVTTGETIALTRRTLVCKVMSLLFNMLSGSFHKLLTLIPQGVDRIENHVHRKQIKLITWTTAFCNSTETMSQAL